MGIALLTTAAFASPEATRAVGRPRDVSAEGHRIDWLIDFSNIWIFILFGAMAVWLIAAVVFHRQGKHKAVYDHGTDKRAWMVAFGIAGFVFFIIDGALFTTSSKDVSEALWNFEGAEAHPDVVRVEVNGHQWLWDFRYAGPDGNFNTKDDVVTTNDLRVPLDRPVLMQISAADVIHSLYIPNLRIKQDAVPGSVSQAVFTAVEEGSYEIACAQHCGAAHYKMRAKVTVLKNDEFEEWAAEQSRDDAQIFDSENADAQWGWPWRKL